MNAMNTDISSWTALTEYPLQEHQCHTTGHTEITTPDQAQGITGKIEKEETAPDHSLDIADIAASAIMTCTEVTPDCSNETDTAAIEAAQDDPLHHTRGTATGPTMIHHTGHTKHLPNTAALQTTTPETAVEHTTAHQATTLKIIVDHIHDHLPIVEV